MARPLEHRHCAPCEDGAPSLPPEEARRLHAEVPGWELGEAAITRRLRLRDFQAAVALIGRIADVAEAEGHHPDLHLHGYNHLDIRLTTHALGGLSENDFILAAKIDRLL